MGSLFYLNLLGYAFIEVLVLFFSLFVEASIDNSFMWHIKAAQSLGAALRINPWKTKEVSRAIYKVCTLIDLNLLV